MKLAGVQLPRMMSEALADCREHFVAAAVFSLLINILYLAPTLYMLQVYDRVVPTGGKTTLLFVTLALALALIDAFGPRHGPQPPAGPGQRAGRCPPRPAHPQADDGHRFRCGRAGDARFRFHSAPRWRTPAIAAIFDPPWTPVFLLVAFMLHFWIGILAVIASRAARDPRLAQPAGDPEEDGDRDARQWQPRTIASRLRRRTARRSRASE